MALPLHESNPELVAEWSPRNEKPITAYTRGSDRKVWWQCAEGHEWLAPISNRSYGRATACPACSPVGARMVVSGFNDLATLRPELAAEWHPTKNTLSPTEVSRGSRKRAWWLCRECGREWEAVIKNRTVRNTGCPSCRGRLRGIAKSGTIQDPQLRAEWSPKNEHGIDFYSTQSNYKAVWVCSEGHEWEAKLDDRVGKQSGCKRCTGAGTSVAEEQLFEYVSSLCADARMHDRTVAAGFEFDISVPSQRIVIEHNGYYWHSDRYKDRQYHARKLKAAHEAGWRLLYIWEGDDPEIVREMVAHKLGHSQKPRLGARKLTVAPVSKDESQHFLDKHHIQGAVPGSVRLGLYHADTLVALMVFRRRSEEGVYELARYATDGIISGGFTKLLKAFQRGYSPVRIVSFSDNGVSDGGVYEQAGFVATAELPPDYSYWTNGRKYHKFNYRKNRFRRDASLKYEEGLTERELADLNNLYRVYDAGKTRWELW